MAAHAALLRITTGLFSTSSRDCHLAQLLETPSNADSICRRSYPTYTKGDDADESATPPRHLRHYRANRDEDYSSHRRWRAGLPEIGGNERRKNSCEPGHNGESLGGRLPNRTPVC